MTWEGYSFFMLSAIRPSPQQLIQLLEPSGGNYPRTEQEFEALAIKLRRMGHLLENAPHPDVLEHCRSRAALTWQLQSTQEKKKRPAVSTRGSRCILEYVQTERSPGSPSKSSEMLRTWSRSSYAIRFLHSQVQRSQAGESSTAFQHPGAAKSGFQSLRPKIAKLDTDTCA